MTDKQKIAGLSFGLAVIAAFGFGWNWLLKFNHKRELNRSPFF